MVMMVMVTWWRHFNFFFFFFFFHLCRIFFLLFFSGIQIKITHKPKIKIKIWQNTPCFTHPLFFFFFS